MDLHEDPHENGSLANERAFADDPFSMAAILRSHADVGPMPDLVAGRISAALSAAERERSTHAQPIATAAGPAANVETGSAASSPAGRADHLRSVPTLPTAPTPWQPGGAARSSGVRSGTAPSHANPSHANPSHANQPGARSSRSRRASALLGIAAATVVIAGGGALLHTLKGNSPTSVGAVAPAATQPSPLTTERQTDGGRVSASPSDLGTPASGVGGAAVSVRIRMSETNYHRSDFAAAAAGLVDTSTDPNATPFTLPPNVAESPAVGPIATDIGMRSCVVGLGVTNPQSVVADIATFDGQPAIIVVIVDQNGGRTAYAAKRSCSQSAPNLLTAPVQLP